jgi:citrate lyase subunit beta/citryl-CoA lyase
MNPGWRSLLFAGADDQARLGKIAERGADAVILDLEDAVPPARKPDARAGLPAAATALAAKGCDLVVRINGSWRDVIADLAVVVRPEVSAIMVPKVESGPRLAVIAEMVAEAAEDAGLAAAPGLIALIESPAGLSELDAIAQVDGVIGLALGSEDFSLALGVPPTPVALELPCRLLALAAARRGLMALGLPISIATIEDEAGWKAAVDLARAIGLTGALCIHPRQIDAVNRGFIPGESEAEAARRILAAWNAADGAGVIKLDGRMIDRPVMLAAQRLLALAAHR